MSNESWKAVMGPEFAGYPSMKTATQIASPNPICWKCDFGYHSQCLGNCQCPDSYHVPLETVPLSPLAPVTIHVCPRRNENGFDTERKFKADCGTKLVVTLTRHYKIRSIKAIDPCAKDCLHCRARIAAIYELIAAGK